MTDDSRLDPRDGELQHRFDAATQRPATDPDAVLDRLRPQMRRARRRHRAALGGLAAGAAVSVAVAGFALTGGTSSPKVDTPPATRSSVPAPDGTTPAPLPTTPTTPAVKALGTNGGASFDGGASESSGPSDSSGPSGDGGGATTTTVPASRSQTFSSNGGSITVTVVDGALSLTATSPAPGSTAQVNKNEAGRVEVEFLDAAQQRVSRIRVDLSGGTMIPTVD